MKNKNIKHIALRIITVVVILIALGGLLYIQQVNNYQQTVSSLTYKDINLSSIPNGTYYGECDVNFIYAKVEVSVNKGEITGINLLEHRNDRGTSAEIIVKHILDAQNLNVDTISGATNSSKVIKKAVENALLSAS